MSKTAPARVSCSSSGAPTSHRRHRPPRTRHTPSARSVRSPRLRRRSPPTSTADHGPGHQSRCSGRWRTGLREAGLVPVRAGGDGGDCREDLSCPSRSAEPSRSRNGPRCRPLCYTGPPVPGADRYPGTQYAATHDRTHCRSPTLTVFMSVMFTGCLPHDPHLLRRVTYAVAGAAAADLDDRHARRRARGPGRCCGPTPSRLPSSPPFPAASGGRQSSLPVPDSLLAGTSSETGPLWLGGAALVFGSVTEDLRARPWIGWASGFAGRDTPAWSFSPGDQTIAAFIGVIGGGSLGLLLRTRLHTPLPLARGGPRICAARPPGSSSATSLGPG